MYDILKKKTVKRTLYTYIYIFHSVFNICVCVFLALSSSLVKKENIQINTYHFLYVVTFIIYLLSKISIFFINHFITTRTFKKRLKKMI